MNNFTLGQFLQVAGSGELLKIGRRSRNGFFAKGRTIDLITNKNIQDAYPEPIWNIYTFDNTDGPGMIVILNDRLED